MVAPSHVFVTVRLRTPEILWRAIAFPFHAASWVIYHGAGHMTNVLGLIANKIMVAESSTRPATPEEMAEDFIGGDENRRPPHAGGHCPDVESKQLEGYL